MKTTIESPAPESLYTCIYCGKVWGRGKDNGTHGICIECFAKWALTKYSCFGNYNEFCEECKISKYCREYYDFKTTM